MTFSLSYDSTTWLFTLLAVLILFFIISVILILGKFKIIKVILIFGIIIIYFFAFLRSPKAYIITNSELIIKTFSKSIEIPISSVKEARKLNKYELKGTKRIKGIGWLFGFSGIFYSRRIGFFEGYFTNQKNLILIKDDKTYVISPDNPNLFLEKIESQIIKRIEEKVQGR